jgi:hypothetical protein
VSRRARTKHLIELGGLVAKAGLVERAGDDRAMLYGAFLDIAQQLEGDDADTRKLRWKRRGARFRCGKMGPAPNEPARGTGPKGWPRSFSRALPVGRPAGVTRTALPKHMTQHVPFSGMAKRYFRDRRIR